MKQYSRIALLFVTIVLVWCASNVAAENKPGRERRGFDEKRMHRQEHPRARRRRHHEAPRHRGGPEHRRKAPQPRELTEKQIDGLMQHVKKHRPEMHERLAELREEDPKRFRQRIGRLSHWYDRWKSIPEYKRRRMQNRREAKQEIFRLLKRFRRAENEEQRDATREEIRNVVASDLEEDLKFQKERVERLKREIEKLRAELEKQKENREKIIDKRVDYLIKLADRARARKIPETPRQDERQQREPRRRRDREPQPQREREE